MDSWIEPMNRIFEVSQIRWIESQELIELPTTSTYTSRIPVIATPPIEIEFKDSSL